MNTQEEPMTLTVEYKDRSREPFKANCSQFYFTRLGWPSMYDARTKTFIHIVNIDEIEKIYVGSTLFWPDGSLHCNDEGKVIDQDKNVVP